MINENTERKIYLSRSSFPYRQTVNVIDASTVRIPSEAARLVLLDINGSKIGSLYHPISSQVTGTLPFSSLSKEIRTVGCIFNADSATSEITYDVDGSTREIFKLPSSSDIIGDIALALFSKKGMPPAIRAILVNNLQLKAPSEVDMYHDTQTNSAIFQTEDRQLYLIPFEGTAFSLRYSGNKEYLYDRNLGWVSAHHDPIEKEALTVVLSDVIQMRKQLMQAQTQGDSSTHPKFQQVQILIDILQQAITSPFGDEIEIQSITPKLLK